MTGPEESACNISPNDSLMPILISSYLSLVACYTKKKAESNIITEDLHRHVYIL